MLFSKALLFAFLIDFASKRASSLIEIISAIEKQDTQMAFEKLQRSSLKNLIDIIPR